MSTIHPEVLAMLHADYLRWEQPPGAACIRRAIIFAEQKELPVPTFGALERHLTRLRQTQPDLVSLARLGRQLGQRASTASASRGKAGQRRAGGGRLPPPTPSA